MLRKRKFLIGGFIVFAAIVYLSYMGFQSAATYYYTVSEVAEQGSSMQGEPVRVNGLVAPGSVEQEPGSFLLKFTIIDIDGEESLPVVYQGVVPDSFRPGSEVVVEGQLNSSDIFQAQTILAKCPSKYAPEE